MLVLGCLWLSAVRYCIILYVAISCSQIRLDLWFDSTDGIKTLFTWSNEHWTGVGTSSGTLLFFVCGIKGMGVGE